MRARGFGPCDFFVLTARSSNAKALPSSAQLLRHRAAVHTARLGNNTYIPSAKQRSHPLRLLIMLLMPQHQKNRKDRGFSDQGKENP